MKPYEYAPYDDTERQILEKYPEQKGDLEKIFGTMAGFDMEIRQSESNPMTVQEYTDVLRSRYGYSAQNRRRIFDVMNRYNDESENQSYTADVSNLVEFIRDEGFLDTAEAFVDLGAGSGDLIASLAPLYPDVNMVGFDLSPGFVRSFNSRNTNPKIRMRASMIDANSMTWDYPILRSGANRLVSSVLTLDRVLYPKKLIDNIRKYGRSRILAALLPNVPEDDNPSRQVEGQKLVYTPPENRIVPGVSKSEDENLLLKYVRREWGPNVELVEVPYKVASSGDVQQYDLSVFYQK